MGKLIGDADQICGYGFSSTYLGNKAAERVNGILKQEFLLHRCRTFAELKILVRESIAIYNDMRPHLSLNMATPNQVHNRKGQLLELA